MTKKEMFALIASVNADNAEIVEFCNHEIALLVKKASTPAKPTANQRENVKFRKAILEALRDADAPMTVSALCECESLKGLKNQRITALLSQLKKEKLVVRSEVKRVPYYSIADGMSIEE